MFLAAIVGAVLALPVSAGATDETTTEETEISFGDYLSGRFASTHRDTGVAASYLNKAVAVDPSNMDLVQQAFSLSLASGKYAEATNLAVQLVAVEGKHTSLVDLVLNADAMQKNDPALVLERLAASKGEGIVNLVLPLSKAWVAAGQGNAEEALASLTVLDSDRSFAVFGAVHRAHILDYLGQHDDAVVAYLEILGKLRGSDMQVALAYGNLLERLGKQEAAIILYQEYLAKYPDNTLLMNAIARANSKEMPSAFISSPAEGLAEAYFNTSRRLANHRSRSPATIYLRLTLMLKPEFPVAQLLLANLQERDRQWEVALDQYTALTDDPDFGWQAKYEQAMVLSRLERKDEAISLLQDMSTQRPDDITVLAALADRMRDAENFQQSRQYYDQVINLVGTPEERHWPLFYSRGVAQEKLGNWKRAEKDFRTALTLRPDEPLVLNYLGYSWLQRGVHLDEALQMIEKAVEQSPEDGYVIDSLGWALYKLTQYEEAIGWLEKAIMLQPEDPTINDHLGDAYWRHGRKLEARFQWQHALVMKPEADDVERIRDKLKNGLPEKHISGR
jgi:tetratricopeptide (TPR) repeat protein